MEDQIELLKSKLDKMDIDDLRDIIGDDSYTALTQEYARKLVNQYDYGTEVL